LTERLERACVCGAGPVGHGRGAGGRLVVERLQAGQQREHLFAVARLAADGIVLPVPAQYYFGEHRKPAQVFGLAYERDAIPVRFEVRALAVVALHEARE
jgi:hypothetical protein